MKLILLSAAVLSIVACATNRPPERQVVQHPSASDVASPRCIGQEPSALTDEQLASDEAGRTHFGDDFEGALVNWGRSCEGALSRVCNFHRDLGMHLPPDLRCDVARHE